MDAVEKFRHLGDALQYEPTEETPPAGMDPRLQAGMAQADKSCGTGCGGSRPAPREKELPIYRAVMPGGRRIPLLKTMLTSACERDCNYCCFRAGRDCSRTTFQKEELAQAFMRLYQAKLVEGLFLSSGMAGGGIKTQDRLIAVAEILRFKLGFRGYLHLKIMPGAEKAQVERAMQLADRVSINLEAPNTYRLAALAPHKAFMDELLQPLRWVEQIRTSMPSHLGWNGHWPSSTTQFVVGGAGEHDIELLSTTEKLNQQVRLARAYYSGFNPVEGTPLENMPPVNPWRQHRLYQASFLLRDYAFNLEEMPFNPEGDLPLKTDPKQAWADQNLREGQVEINRAERIELLRVPGIGPKGANRIILARKQHRICSLDDLKALGIRPSRAAPYILLDGWKPPVQLSLF